MKIENGKLILNGIDFDNPLDNPIFKRNYSEGKDSPRISFRQIWLDRYIIDCKAATSEYQAWALKLCSNGKVYLDEKEIKDKDDVSSVKEIFNQIRIE